MDRPVGLDPPERVALSVSFAGVAFERVTVVGLGVVVRVGLATVWSLISVPLPPSLVSEKRSPEND